MPLLEFNAVSKVYISGSRKRSRSSKNGPVSGTDIQAVKDISFSISPGQSIGIVGESGAGKSTLAAIATGQTLPTSGAVLVDGKALTNTQSERRWLARKVQMVWQDAASCVDPRFRVDRIIAEPLSIHERRDREGTGDSVARLMSEVGLAPGLARRYPHELSGGELQRLVIARALALDPELLICDEPASALDAITKLQLANLLTRIRRQRELALLVIAHDLQLVRKITDEMIVMRRGAIVERGATALISKNPQHPYSQLLMNSDPSTAFQKLTAAGRQVSQV